MSELPDDFTPSWRNLLYGGGVPPPYLCFNCGLEVRELSRSTSYGRTLTKGIWYHVDNEGRLCDPDSPLGARGPKAYPNHESG